MILKLVFELDTVFQYVYVLDGAKFDLKKKLVKVNSRFERDSKVV